MAIVVDQDRVVGPGARSVTGYFHIVAGVISHHLQWLSGVFDRHRGG